MSSGADRTTVITDGGEMVLRRRCVDGALELRVNGVFVMDTVHTETERMLAVEALSRAPDRELRMLIGGLGLGFTLRTALADTRVRAVDVVEIEPELVAWHRAGRIPDTFAALRDNRVTVHVADVSRFCTTAAAGSAGRDVPARVSGSTTSPYEMYDIVLLDVDNGPDYLVYDANTAVYGTDFLAACRNVTRPGGVVAIWSGDTAPALLGRLQAVFDAATELEIPVSLGSRASSYFLLLARVGDAGGRGDIGEFGECAEKSREPESATDVD